MSEIRYSQGASTFSSVLAVGLIAAQLLNSPFETNTDDQLAIPLTQDIYSIRGSKYTFNSYGNPITGDYESAPIGFEQKVGNFYGRLLASQEPLGPEFEKVLYENLWDLYES
jgi:hypothetical protein